MRASLALLVLACAKPPVAPPPIATPPPPTVAVTHRGRLVLHTQQQRLIVCLEDQTCGEPSQPVAVVQDQDARYLVSTKDQSFVLNVATGTTEPMAEPGVMVRLDDGALIKFEHLSRRSRVFHKTKTQDWTALFAYEKFQALEFRFLRDGRHLFKDSPGMGGQESPYFTDLVLGHPTHLYVVDKIGGKPLRVHTSSQQMDADFIDAGLRIVWWQPGSTDKGRTIHLQVLDPGKTAKTIATVATDFTTRSAPRTSSSLQSRWVVYAADKVHAIDAATGEQHDLDATLVPGIPHESVYNHNHTRRWSDHIVVREGEELRVLAIPSFEVIYRVTATATAADWVPM
jgi:hypothetical protein